MPVRARSPVDLLESGPRTPPHRPALPVHAPHEIHSVALSLGVIVLRRLILAALFAVPAAAQQPKADLVLLHGKVVTVDSQHPNAQAIAVRGDRIVAVGSDDEIQKLA